MATPLPRRSSLRVAVETHLGETTLDDFVLSRWPQAGWRKVAADLTAATGVPVSHETLRAWFEGRLKVTVQIEPDSQAA
jgi:hypothetical protein